MKKILEKTNKDKLIAFIEEYAKRNNHFANALLVYFAEPDFELEISKIKTSIKIAFLEASEDDWGDWNIDFSDIYDEVSVRINQGHFHLAFAEIGALYRKVMENYWDYDLETEAEECLNIIKEIANKIQEEETQKLIFRKCIELLDVSENADILEAAVKVVTIDNRQEFEEILNRLDDDHSQEQYKMIRLEFINKFQDEEAAINFIEDNLMFPKIREIAFERALKAQKFEKAILLCIDALSLEEKSFGISQWLYKLFFVYETLENYSEMIHTAEKILFLGDIKFFDILKAIFIKQKLWESVQTDLLKKCKEKLYYTNYMKILNNEEKHTLLLEALMENDDQIYEYGGSVLTNKYPDEICALFINQINKTADNASSRSSYSWVCEKIEIFVQAGFQEKGVELVKTLKTKYSRRSAFVNELQKLEKRIMPTISPF